MELEELERKLDKEIWVAIAYYHNNKDDMAGLTQGEKEVVLKHILNVMHEELIRERLENQMPNYIGDTVKKVRDMMDGKQTINLQNFEPPKEDENEE